MQPTSVILPDLSTAKLPDAEIIRSGHPTGMELTAVLKRIERRLQDLGISADAASRQAGKPDAIRNMRRAVQSGRKGVNTGTVAALAPVLRTTLAWLLEGKGDKEAADGVQRRKGIVVPLVGYVGAGAAAHYYDVPQSHLDDVQAPAISDNTVAVEVRGESLGPIFDRWLVFYDDVRRPVTPDLIGKLCVVSLTDQRILIKKIRPGRNGRLRLLSAQHEVIEDAEVDWAAQVKLMMPPR